MTLTTPLVAPLASLLDVSLTGTASVVITAPQITSLTVPSVTDTTAQIDVTATPVGATVYLYVSTSATPPSAVDLKAGTGAVWSGSVTITGVPAATAGPSGLTASTSYHVHALAEYSSQQSAISTASFTTAAPDVTAPILSGATATVLDTTSADLDVTTDEANGELYVVVTTTQGTPTAVQMRAGQDSTGATGAFQNGGGGGQAVSATGAQSLTATGLTTVAHYAYFMQDDAAGNTSTIVEVGPFTPADVTAPAVSSVELANATPTTLDVTFNTDTGEGTAYVLLLATPATTPSVATVKASTDTITVTASGPQSITVSSLTETTEYTAFVVHTDVAVNDSTVVEASAPLSTISSSVLYTFFADGTDTGAVGLSNCTATENVADPDGGTTAVTFANSGTAGTGVANLVQFSVGVTFADANNEVRFKFKSNNATAFYARMPVLSTNHPNNGQLLIVNVTDDATPAGSRGTGSTLWQNVVVTALTGGWYEVVAEVDMTGVTDRSGFIQIQFAMSSTTSGVTNDTAGEYSLTLNDFTVTQL